MTPRRSVFLDALGDAAATLKPEVYEYVAGPPCAPNSTHSVGIGEGVFAVAGSRFGLVFALLRPVIGPDTLVTRHERDVPFEIVNTPAVLADGSLQLAATRTFKFQGGEQRFLDVLTPAGAPGMLLNHLGPRKRLTLTLKCSVSAQGHLLLTSERTYLRVGRSRIRLPRLLGVSAHVEDGYDSERQRRTVDVVVRNPIAGVVLHYRGWFHYRYRDDGAAL